jgi:hypothetical protein
LLERWQLFWLAQSALLAGLEWGRMAEVVVLLVTVTGVLLLPLPEEGHVGERVCRPLLFRCALRRRRRGVIQSGILSESRGSRGGERMGGRCRLRIGLGFKKRQRRLDRGGRSGGRKGGSDGVVLHTCTYRSQTGQGSLRSTNVFWRGHSARVVEVAMRDIVESKVLHDSVRSTLYSVSSATDSERRDGI